MSKSEVIRMLQSIGKSYEELDSTIDGYDIVIITDGVNFGFLENVLIDFWSMD